MKVLFPKISPKKVYILVSLFLIGLLAVAGISYFYFQYAKSQAEIAHLRELSKSGTTEEVEQLVSAVGKLMELPTGENPTVATIKDKEKLKDQPFFDRAENGDRLLIYAQAKRAILYRPSTNKIIDISSLNIGSSAPTPTPTPQPK